MRKFLLTLAVLCGTVSGWAQTDLIKVSTNVDVPEHVYTIKSGNDYYMYPTTGPASSMEKAGMFVFLNGEKEGDLKIFCLSNKKWVSYTPNEANNTTDFAQLIDNEAETKSWKATLVNDGKDNVTTCYQFQPYNSEGETYTSYMNWNGGVGWGYNLDEAKTVGVWTDDAAKDKGSAWIVEEVVLPFEISKDYDNAHWLNLNIRDDGPTYLYYDANTDYIKTDAALPTDEDKFKWAIIGNVVDGFKILNKAAGKDYVLSSPKAPTTEKNADELPRMVEESKITGEGNVRWTIRLATHDNAVAGTFIIEHPDNTSYALNRQGYNGVNTVCYWTGRDTGSALQATNVLKYEGGNWGSFWTAAEIYPEGLIASLNDELCECTDVYKHEEIIKVLGTSFSAQFKYTGGNKRIDILGVDLVNTTGEVVASDYHFGFSGGSQHLPIYNLNGLTEGTYLIRFYVSNGNDGELSKTTGGIVLKHIELATQDEVSTFFTDVKTVAANKYTIANPFAGTTYGCYEETGVLNLNESLNIVGEIASATNSGILVDAIGNLSKILPQPGKFYRFKHPSEDIYMLSDVDTQDSKRLDMGTSKVSSVFYLTKENCLLSYDKGLYAPKAERNGNWTCSAVGTTPQEITFDLGTQKGRIGFYIGDDPTRAYYSGGKTNVNAGGNIAQSEGYDWIVEEVTWLPVPMKTELGYATIYSPVELELSQNRVKAYTATINESGNAITLTEQSVVPANIGVVLEYQEGAEMENGCVYLQIKETTLTDVESQLCGTLADSYVAGDGYILAKPGGYETGFYKAMKNFTVAENGTGTKVAEGAIGTHFLNNGFKAYLPAPVSGARFYVFDFGTETAIENIEGAESANDAVIYDLAGRRVQNALKGLYIVNGKKVIK